MAERYKKARWWGLWPCAYKGDVFGVKVDYGDWWGPTVLIHNAKYLTYHPRIRRKDRDWLLSVLKEKGV